MNKQQLLEKQTKIAEEIFGTEHDPDQMPVSLETAQKLELCEGWLETEFDEAGEPISWAVVMPTQRVLAEKFLNKEINEKDLLNMTEPREIYDALYIVSIITVSEHRGKGLSLKVLTRAIPKIPLTEDALYFTWPTTPEGEGAIAKFTKSFKKEVRERK